MPVALLAALVVQLPLEFRAPLLVLGGLRITNLELTAALAIVAAAGPALRRNRPFDALDWAALGWSAAWLAAALASPWGHPAALKHVARLSAGPVLMVLLRGALDVPAALSTTRWLGLIGAAAGAAGLLEILLPAATAPLFSPFREKPTTSPYGLRASATFEHANQLAAFSEITLPFLAAGLAGPAGLRRRSLAALAVGTAGLLFAMSRAGWAAGLAGLGLTLWLARRALRRGAALRGAMAVAATVLACLAGSERLRSRAWPGAGEGRLFAYAISFSDDPGPRIVVTNLTVGTWPAGPGGVRLSVLGRRLTPPPKEREVFLPFPRDVPPGGRVEIPIDPAGTLPPGRYLHVYEVVHPSFGYGSQWEIAPLSGETIVEAGRARLRYGRTPGALRLPAPSRGDLWRAARAAFPERPWLGLGPGEFQVHSSRWLTRHQHDPRLHPNHLWLHHLAEGGLAAAAGLFALVTAAAARLVPRLRGRKPESAACGGAGALLAWNLHGFFDSFLFFNGCALAFWLGLAVSTPKGEAR